MVRQLQIDPDDQRILLNPMEFPMPSAIQSLITQPAKLRHLWLARLYVGVNGNGRNADVTGRVLAYAAG